MRRPGFWIAVTFFTACVVVWTVSFVSVGWLILLEKGVLQWN